MDEIALHCVINLNGLRKLTRVWPLAYPATGCWLCNNMRPIWVMNVRYLLTLSSLSHLPSQSRILGPFQKALLTRCSEGLYLTLAIVAWGQPPLPQGT